MTEKEVFLQSVRQALARRGDPIPLADEHEVARVISDRVDPVAVFLSRMQQAKMHVYRVPDEDAMVEQVMQIVASVQAASAVFPDDGLPARERILAALGRGGVSVLDADDRDAAFVADVGITGVSCAIAETGSMVLASGGKRRRLASLAVPLHIGIVRAGQILPDLLDWAQQSSPDRPAAEVLVSAPSKTADIELTLVMGVHGPKQEHVIVIG